MVWNPWMGPQGVMAGAITRDFDFDPVGEPLRLMVMTGICEMCLREELPLTKHHLIPRSLHKNKQVKKRHEQEEMTTRLLWICRSCHNHLHSVIPIKELERDFDTKEALFAHPEIVKYLEWIRGRKVGGRVAVKRRSRRRR